MTKKELVNEVGGNVIEYRREGGWVGGIKGLMPKIRTFRGKTSCPMSQNYKRVREKKEKTMQWGSSILEGKRKRKEKKKVEGKSEGLFAPSRVFAGGGLWTNTSTFLAWCCREGGGKVWNVGTGRGSKSNRPLMMKGSVESAENPK